MEECEAVRQGELPTAQVSLPCGAFISCHSFPVILRSSLDLAMCLCNSLLNLFPVLYFSSSPLEYLKDVQPARNQNNLLKFKDLG